MAILRKSGGIVVLVILVVLIAGIISTLVRNRNFSDDPFNAIPADVAFIMRIKSVNNLKSVLNNENKIWDDLTALDNLGKINSFVEYYDSLLSKNERLSRLIPDLSLMITGFQTKKSNIDFAYFIEAPKDFNKRKLFEILNTICEDKANVLSKRKFNGFLISEIRTKNNQTFSLVFINNQVVVSPSSIVIEKCILQTKADKSLMDDPAFNKAYAAAGNSALANLFIQYSRFPSMFNNQVLKPHDIFLENFSNYASWSSLDLNIKPDEISLGGFTVSDASMNYDFSVFLNQAPQKILVAEILPSNTAFFISLGIPDIQQYIEARKALEKKNGEKRSHFDQIKTDNANLSFKIDETFYTLFDHEISLAYTAFSDLTEKENILVALQTKSSGIAEVKMNELLAACAKAANKPIESFITKETIDNELTYNIYNLPIYKALGKVFGDLFNPIEEPFYTFIDNYLVFSNSARLLERLKKMNIQQQNLANDYSYKTFAQSYSELSNILIYSSIANSKKLNKNFLSTLTFSKIYDNKKAFQGIDKFGIQFSANDNMLYTNAFIKYSESDNTLARTEWKTLLDTVANMKPQLLANHLNHQNEIFIQDASNNIYLISQSGRILWKIPLGEKIVNQVYQIDAFKNNKLQILFSTHSKIFLIDRNGNIVENFPIILRSPATAGVAVFDYEDDKNYRFFIPCEDKKVYACDIEGQVVQGWDFKGSEGRVSQPVQHIRIGDKDYIVFNDEFRTYILDRKGSERVAVTEIVPVSQNNRYIPDVINRKNKPRILVTDTAGVVNYIYFDGTMERKKLGHFDPDHYFDFKDINGDLNEEYIYLDNNTLTVYDQDGIKVLNYIFKETINDPFVYFQFSALDKKIGVVSRESDRIYLINSNGSLYNGFPLTGTTLFSIGRLNPAEPRFNLLVGNSDNFLLNYSVK